MKILIICGSVAKKSHTYTLLKYIQNLLEEKKAEAIFWDLRVKPLPIAVPEFHKDPALTPDKSVKEFVAAVNNSDGFVLGSPLYHGSYSGVLKNALDNLYYDAFRNKPVALVANSSSIRNSVIPCDHLRLVVRALYGYALQSQISTANSDYENSEKGLILIDENIKERCERLVNELIAFASILKKNAVNK